ncbi:hypothetical protein MHOCP_22170 [Moorella humiferrea]|uniref:LVIVD repeat-containing protein n=1 Tax=Neomoorella humiferrea TaxID=676965 RepID=UPI0030CE8E58
MALRLLGHTDLNGNGATMQLMSTRGILFVGHMKPGLGTSIVDVTDPRRPQVIGSLPGFENTLSPKVQIAGDLLLVNYEQRGANQAARVGFAVYDISNPVRPKEIAYYNTGGKGVHRIWYTGGRYAFLSAVPPGFRDRMLLIIDMQDPEHPCEAGRWWLPGLWAEGGEAPDWPEEMRCCLHHAVVAGDRAYLGFWDAGVIILDITNINSPKQISRLSWAPREGSCTHTALPLTGRNLLVVTDESTKPRCQEPPKYVRIIDIKNEREPQEIAKCPPPEGDFCNRGLRFGPHNLHENRPGSFISENIIYVTYFNAGLRVYDITRPERPVEVDRFLPPAPPGIEAIQINDVYVEAGGLVYISDRAGAGVYILES